MLFASELTSSLSPGANGSAGMLGSAAGAAVMVGTCAGTVASAGVNWFDVL